MIEKYLDNIFGMGHQYNQRDNYKLDDALWLRIEHLLRTYQGMDPCIYIYGRHDWSGIRHSLRTLVDNRVANLGNLVSKSKQLDYFVPRIYCLVHMAMVCMDFALVEEFLREDN